MVPAVWRKVRNEDTALLLEGQQTRSYTPSKKKGVLAKLCKTNNGHRPAHTPPLTPDEKYDVAVIASEYDPSRFYAPSGPKPVTRYPSTQMRKVEFNDLSFEYIPLEEEPYFIPGLPMPETPTVTTSRAASVPSTPPIEQAEDPRKNAKDCGNSVYGFLDELCQIPKVDEPVSMENADNAGLQWEMPPSCVQEDESTLQSVPFTTGESTAEYSRSMMNSQSLDDSAAVEEEQGEEYPALEESPSHENFEVVLDSSLLSSPPPSPQPSPKRNWFQNKTPHSNEESAVKSEEALKPRTRDGKQKSLVRRLFLGRRKITAEEPKEEIPEEEPEDEEQPQVLEEYLEEEPHEEPQEEPEMAPMEEPPINARTIDIPDRTNVCPPEEPSPTTPAKLEPKPLANLGHTQSSPPAFRFGRYNVRSAPSQEPTTPTTTADDIMSTLGNIFSALDPLGSRFQEEKKENDCVVVEDPEYEESPTRNAKSFGDEGYPDDETEDNRTPIPEYAEKGWRERSRSVDATPGKRWRSSRRTLSFGGLAKKITKQFVKKNKEETTADPPGDFTKLATLDATPIAEKKKKSKKDKPLWKSTVDPNTGRIYWYNRITRESTYNPPPEAFESTTPTTSEPKSPPEEKTSIEPSPGLDTTEKAAAPSAGFSTPKKNNKAKLTWKAVVDKNSGRTYYYHRKTRETTWTMPEELKQHMETKALAQGETPLHKNYTVASNQSNKIDPPLVVEAEMTKESQQRINRGEKGLLGTSFESDDRALLEMNGPLADKRKEIRRLLNSLSPDGASAEQLLRDFAGRENFLLMQLRERVETRPFDEPAVIDLGEKPSPARLTGRSGTFLSKSSAATRSSTITDKTERIRNTRVGKSRFETIGETMSSATSISSHQREDAPGASQHHLGAAAAVLRERDLKVEELTGARVAAETFQSGRIVRTRNTNPMDDIDDGSYYGDDEDQSHGVGGGGDDSVSALSEQDVDFSNRRDNFEQARRRALDDAIEREDWDLAAALSEGMPANINNTVGDDDYANAHSTWNQSDLDKFIANNDWDAVKSYIARMREAKKEGHDVGPPPGSTAAKYYHPYTSESALAAPRTTGISGLVSLSAVGESDELRRRVGSRSRLQHNQHPKNNLLSSADSSWTSDEEPSYDSGTEDYEGESDDSDSS